MNFILFLIKKLHFSSKNARWHLKLEKSFPNNSPLQLTLIRTRQLLHCTGYEQMPMVYLWSWKTFIITQVLGEVQKHIILQGFAQGWKFATELLAQNWNEINFYFQLIRYLKNKLKFLVVKRGEKDSKRLLHKSLKFPWKHF